MKDAIKAIVGIGIVAVACCNIHAQIAFGDEGDDNPRGNTNLAMPLSAPLNPTAQLVHLGWGVTLGAGYNFTRRHALVGEFMWNYLYPTGGALNEIRAALQNPNLHANGNLYALTGNYRFELRGHAVGTYLIGGGGLYYRNSRLSQPVTTGSSITCTPTWLWFGFTCESGTVTANQTLASSSSSSLGVNGGIGFTSRVGEAPYRVYVETRYHYAPGKGVNTQLVSVTLGIRY